MKKLMLVLVGVMSVAFAKADVNWSWWLDKKSADTDFSFGLASKCKSVSNLELSLFYSASPVRSGAQLTALGLNDSDASCPLQMAFVNRGKSPCVQLGFLNLCDKSTFDMGFANLASEAKFQLGFLNFNKKGFLPVFVFVNFDPSIFK